MPLSCFLVVSELHASRNELHASRYELHAFRYELHASRYELHAYSSPFYCSFYVPRTCF
jgi:hypothetical protein